jgi:hypothetical protein
MSTYGINVPSPDVITYPEAHQQPRVQAALTWIDPGDVLAVIDSRIAAEADPQAHPFYTQPRSTQRHSTGVLLGHRTSSVPRLPAVSFILALLIVAQIALVSPASAQDCQYSPYWGEHGELWDPNGPLKDWSTVGYHEGDDPIPYQQRPAAMEFGPGRHTITDRIHLTQGVLRGAGMDQTTLYFPQGLDGMGYDCDWDDCHDWDWDGAVITAIGTEIGIEDLTIEFAPHSYVHHTGEGFNGIALGGMRAIGGGNGVSDSCDHCWISHVRVINADDAILIWGSQSTIEHIEIVHGHHAQINTGGWAHHNLVRHVTTTGKSRHGLGAGWCAAMNVFSHAFGEPIRIEPDHNTGCGTHDNLFTNLLGPSGKISRIVGDNLVWNFKTVTTCPLDLYEAQYERRYGGTPP